MEYKKNFIDQIYDFEGLWGMPSKCGIKIVEKEDKTIVIATELYKENPGSSTVDFCAGLANSICKDFNIKPEKLFFIQHNPDIESHLDFMQESFDKVDFETKTGEFKDPKWSPMKKKEVEAILKN